ncbi:MAG: diguanylate cyclase, partial [Candidatus Obscuribacterales bacterium]|nr:diguanylate cyclase [Candidatus Obscuribacterales bacterium]
MAEPGGSQLQMMLVQQAGPGALPLSILSPAEFLPFIRDVEQLAVAEKLAPVLVYWSRRSAAWLLPTGPRFKELMRDAFCVSIFSEDRQDTPDEWCFLIESRGLCLILYAQQALESPQGEKYQCSGSMNAQIVRQAFNRLLPAWQAIELGESNRLEDARVNLGPCGSANHFVDKIRNLWPVVKSPIQQNLILKPQEIPQQPPIIVDHGKVSPIALEASAFPSAAVVAPPRPLPAQQPGASPISPPSPFAVPGVGSGGDGGANDQLRAQQVRTQPLPKPSAFELPKPKQLKDQEYLNTAESEFETTGDLTEKLGAVIGPDGQPLPPRPSALRGLRQTLADENQAPQEDVIIPVPAQAIISDIIGQLRHSSDLTSILQYAIETLTQVVQAERGLIWQVVGDQLAVTNEFATSGHTCFVGNQLGSQESTAIVLEFLSRFPDESGAGVISIPDTSHDTNLHKMSPTLSSLIELGEVRGRLMVQLRSRGIFSGFLELQQCGGPREWSRHDAVILQSVAEMLSVVVQQSFDQSKIEMDAREMKLINEIASLFRDSRGQSTEESLVKSVMLVAEHMGFTHSQIYLYDAEENVLKAQIKGGGHSLVDMNNKDNPFVAVFESGRGKIVNAEFTRKGDKFFGHDMALVLPLISEGERLGVIGLWQRLPNKPQFRPQDRELGLTIAGHLSNVIRAEQAITMIRAEQARAALINKVSSEIRQSLKEVDQIMETLVECVHEYFGLSLCVVSLFDSQQQDFTKSKTAGLEPPPAKVIQTPDEIGEPVIEEEEPAIPNFGEQLLLSMLDELKLEQRIFMTAEQIKEKLAGKTIEIPEDLKSATLFPLVHAGNFKAGLCLVSSERESPFPEKDMHMVTDLADRVAVVVSHAELFAQVERQAVTDPMTGLFNRRYFTEQLTKEIDRYQRFGHPFSYIIVDLDYLKKINDSLGHHFGDAAIKHIANVMKRSVRDVDTVGRFGGEEFVVLLPETAHENARMVANRICAAIRAKPVEGIGVITASLGLATFPQDAQDKDKLQELA